MDDYAELEAELDTFSLILPLPFRVASTIVLGVWAWGLNLQYLKRVQIDVPALIRYPSRNSPTSPPHHLSTYRFAIILTIPLIVSILLFWLLTGADPAYVLKWEILPNLYLLFLALAFLLPFRAAYNGRKRFLSTLRRVSIGGIAQLGEGKFGDILMADVLTSYSKVLGDLFVALCMMFTRRRSTAMPDRNCGGQFLVPILISIPSLIRLRQCLIEFSRVKKAHIPGQGWGGTHLANALKYASAFPVIILSALQRGYDSVGMSDDGLFTLWMMAVFVNSLYSFYWDVARDWDLNLFSAEHFRRQRRDSAGVQTRPRSVSALSSSSVGGRGGAYPYGLRRHRYFHQPVIYYVVIFVDFLLRFIWSFKLSPHLDHFNELEGGIWAMELLEVFRRWIWVFFRVETEWVRGLKGAVSDERREELLLGEFGDVEANKWTTDSDGEDSEDGANANGEASLLR